MGRIRSGKSLSGVRGKPSGRLRKETRHDHVAGHTSQFKVNRTFWFIPCCTQLMIERARR